MISKRTLYRSSISGRFVAKSFVKTHPRTTETEERSIRAKKHATKIYRSAASGQFVDRSEVEANPRETETEERRIRAKKHAKKPQNHH